MPTMFEWVREELVAAGEGGCCLADLHKKRKEGYAELGLRQVRGTYNSFATSFSVLIRLGFVEPTGVEEPSYIQRASEKAKEKAPPRKYFRITLEGLNAPITDWSFPIIALMGKYPDRYPTAKLEGKYPKYLRKYIPTGRPRGAPRMPDRKVKVVERRYHYSPEEFEALLAFAKLDGLNIGTTVAENTKAVNILMEGVIRAYIAERRSH